TESTGTRIREALKTIAKRGWPAGALLPSLERQDPSLGWIGIRTTIEEEEAAFRDSHKRLQGLVDTYAVITGKAMEVMPIVIVREAQNSKGKIRYFGWWGYGKVPRKGTIDRQAAR